MSLTGQSQDTNTTKPVRLAVFDFDGTCIEGNSPVLLVKHLLRQGLIKKRVVFRILLWAAAYKLRLPQNEAGVRSLVFSAFEGKNVEEVDTYLGAFYEEHIALRFREQADAAMRRHAAAGDVVFVVSASFEPVILRAMKNHPFSCQVSTRMAIADDGTYMSCVDGHPIEGAHKLAAVQAYANKEYGENAWEIVAAYGDHHSDRTILGASLTPCAVNPDRPLTRTAKLKGWTILNW